MNEAPIGKEERDYLQEACFYLAELKKPDNEIASELGIKEEEVRVFILDYRKKINNGEVTYDLESKDFWSRANRESEGDERITLVDDKGRYYHGWSSEMEKMSTEQLVELLVLNKKYSDAHPLSEFSKTQPSVGYDPIIPLRNIRHAVSIIDGILQKRELEDSSSSSTSV